MADNTQTPAFKNENEFEKALVNMLHDHGWVDGMLQYKTEDDLVKNWTSILYANNRQIDKLNNYPLTDTEMQQVIDQVNMLKNPFETNRFINGCEVVIKRDNKNDKEHYGREVYLTIFDSKEIASGKSRYQIVRQPKFETANPLLGERRGDVMLLINGMPVIHIELKRTGVDVSQAVYQIKRYTHEGVFERGIFSLVQVFVAMTPEKTLYFANPGKTENFNDSYWFHWGDFNNAPVNDWRRVTSDLLSIPMAHQLVGYYTIADEKDKTLKVLRSYQYYAVTQISDKVHLHDWNSYKQEGGYIWHTTGSGKTMTSFKSAQLIANSNDADKVVFLMDRIELSTQSLDEYKGFAGDSDTVSGTENTDALIALLKSDNRDDRLIVTSIQKMSKLGTSRINLPQTELDKIAAKRIVIIVDECHRDVFGKMLMQIKQTFKKALLFGFTGTPIFDDKNEGEISTEAIFGKELHRYSITDGITDKNVLGFDPYKVETYEENTLRRMVALLKAGVEDETELDGKDGAWKKYNTWMLEKDMVAVEAALPKEVFRSREHHEAVISNIMEQWNTLSLNGKFHAILAVKSIKEAIDYYEAFKEMCPKLKVTSVFNDGIDNSDDGIAKEESIVKILQDYNTAYGTSFTQNTYTLFKKDVQKRLAHKVPYIGIEAEKTKTLDLLIVVSQMLTGYDSKWVNTLYVDKLMDMHNLVQGFSRTNRLFGPEKPFGIIKYYDCPNTMEQNIEKAIDAYSGNRSFGIFVQKLEHHLNEINRLYEEIAAVFEGAGIEDYVKLPDAMEERRMFAVKFNDLNHKLEAARLQGFVWNSLEYHFTDEETGEDRTITIQMDYETYMVLKQRYRELFDGGNGGGGGGDDIDAIPIEPYITETSTGAIDAEYMNTKFIKYVKQLYLDGPGSEASKAALKELHKSFASLSQKNQRTAIIILHAIQCGDLRLENGKSIMDYIADYQDDELAEQIRIFSEGTGVDAAQLRDLVLKDLNSTNFNDFGRFDKLRASADATKLAEFTKQVLGATGPVFAIRMQFANMLKDFVIDDDARVRVISAYKQGVTIHELVAEPSPEEQWVQTIDEGNEPEPEVEPVVPDTEVPEQEDTIETAAQAMSRRIKECLNADDDLERVLHKPMSEIIQSVFKVLSMESTTSLDGVNFEIMQSLTRLYMNDSLNFVEKHKCTKDLVSQFEPYLKKLYYLQHHHVIAPSQLGFDPTMKDALKCHPCLWDLKYTPTYTAKKLFRTLRTVVDYRNNFAHQSPILSDLELDKCLRYTMVMYFYVSGSLIDEIENANSRYTGSQVAQDDRSPWKED